MSLKSSPYSSLPPVRKATPTSVRPPFHAPFKNQGRSNSTSKGNNSTNKNPFDKPSLLIRKKTNSFLLHTSNATLSTIHDSNATLPALSKTSLGQIKGSDPRAQGFRSKGRSNTTNILDTSSGGTLNSYTHSHSSAKLTRGNSLEPFLDQQNLSRICDPVTEISTVSEVSIPEKKAPAPRKAIQLIPLNLSQITGKYEKPPQSVERDMKSYIKKVHAIDKLDSRRFKKRGLSEERNEGAIACRESLSKIPGLKPEEKERLLSVSIDDENYFQKIESAINDTSKRIDRDQRLTQTIELVNGEYTKMDVQKNMWRYSFLATKGMLAPLEVCKKRIFEGEINLDVVVKTPKESKSLRVYISRSQKKPSKGNYDLEFENKKSFRIYDKDRTAQFFNTQYLYFAFCIDVSEHISVKINFAEPENTKKFVDHHRYTPHSKWIKPRFLTEENEDFDVNKDVDRVNDYLKVKHAKDIIELNRSNLDRFSIEARKQSLEAKKHKLDSLVKKTLETKQDIVQQKRKQSYLKIISKDVQKGLKDIMWENHEKRVKAEIMGKRWLTCMTMMNMAKHMFECLQRGREKERIRMQRALAATMIAIKYRNSQKFKGPDVKYRMTLDIRSALSMTASLIQESDSYKNGKIEEQENAESLMITFLQDSREVHYLRNRINIVIQRITGIQTVWKKFLKKKENFLEILRRLWIRNSPYIFETVILPKMKKDFERKEKINQIKNFDIKNNEKAQEKFVNGYYRTCVTNYEKKYAVYRDKLRGVDRTKQIVLNFFDLLKRGMEEDEEEEAEPQPKVVTQKTISILEEIESNKIESDSNVGEPTIRPPRLFILPNMKDVEEFFAQCIENQIVESIFPRKNDRLLKALNSFNKKIAKN